MTVSHGSSYQQAEFPLTFRQYVPAYLRDGSGCRRAKHTGHKEFTHLQTEKKEDSSINSSFLSRMHARNLPRSIGFAWDAISRFSRCTIQQLRISNDAVHASVRLKEETTNDYGNVGRDYEIYTYRKRDKLWCKNVK